jgi:hypothetical protein
MFVRKLIDNMGRLHAAFTEADSTEMSKYMFVRYVCVFVCMHITRNIYEQKSPNICIVRLLGIVCVCRYVYVHVDCGNENCTFRGCFLCVFVICIHT